MNTQNTKQLEDVVSFASNTDFKKEVEFKDEKVFRLLKSISAALRDNNATIKSVKHIGDGAYSFIAHSDLSRFSITAIKKDLSVIVRAQRL